MSIKSEMLKKAKRGKRNNTIGCCVTNETMELVWKHSVEMGISAKRFAEYAVEKLVAELEAEESGKKNSAAEKK